MRWAVEQCHLFFDEGELMFHEQLANTSRLRVMLDSHEAGAVSSKKKVSVAGQPRRIFPQDMHTEIMWGYAAAVTFLDAQLGRILDALDRLQLWDDVTVVLTSDHGIHNGEKGMW